MNICTLRYVFIADVYIASCICANVLSVDDMRDRGTYFSCLYAMPVCVFQAVQRTKVQERAVC